MIPRKIRSIERFTLPLNSVRRGRVQSFFLAVFTVVPLCIEKVSKFGTRVLVLVLLIRALVRGRCDASGPRFGKTLRDPASSRPVAFSRALVLVVPLFKCPGFTREKLRELREI